VPLRLNLSKSGLGASLGTKGARLGLSSKGKLYTHLGRWGLYQRQDLGSVKLEPATSSKGIGFWILIALAILVVLVIALTIASAADRLGVFDLVFALAAQIPKWKNTGEPSKHWPEVEDDRLESR
jgi:hypothetical protein